MDDEVKELVKSIKNRCAIFFYICNEPDAEPLLATLLEDLHKDSQEIMDKFCIVGVKEG